jgi:hypothetical protein
MRTSYLSCIRIQQSFDCVTWLWLRYVNMVTVLHDCNFGTISLQPCSNQWFYNKISKTNMKSSWPHLSCCFVRNAFNSLFRNYSLFLLLKIKKSFSRLKIYLMCCVDPKQLEKQLKYQVFKSRHIKYIFKREKLFLIFKSKKRE